MLRKVLFAFTMLILCITFVTADTIKGKITKIDDKNVTVTVGKKGETESKTFKIAAGCKVCKTEKKQKEEVKDGLKSDLLTNLPAKGLGATLTTNDKNEVTEIVVGGGKKKKDAK